MKHFHSYTSSPVGKLILIANEKSLLGVLWPNEPMSRTRLEPGIQADSHPVLIQAQAQLCEYFEGKRYLFDLPLELSGTKFQKAVWKGLTAIPYGQTRSYSELAVKIGSPKACRAVGSANGRNPISIIVPCHRVIGADGGLGGFAGGLQVKEFLLKLEKSKEI